MGTAAGHKALTIKPVTNNFFLLSTTLLSTNTLICTTSLTVASACAKIQAFLAACKVCLTEGISMYAGFFQLPRITLVVLLGSFFSLSSQVASRAAVPTASLISPADKAALEKYIKEHSGFNERTKDKSKSNQSSSKKKYWVAGGVTLLVAAIILMWYLEAGKKVVDPAIAAAASNLVGTSIVSLAIPLAAQLVKPPVPPLVNAADGYLRAVLANRYGNNKNS
jgi:hypothetical protein